MTRFYPLLEKIRIKRSG